MKKLMILGASRSQIPLIEAAKQAGFYTIAASTPGDWPGFAQAEQSSFTDISDPEAVYQAAKEHEINGIATCCLDTGVRAIGYTAERLGLSGPGALAAECASNKFEMKEAFVKGGVNCAKHIKVSSQEEFEKAVQNLRFPVVTKAVDLMGSRGIYRCNTLEEARRNYELTMEATNQNYCIIEEFIEGTTFGVEAMIQNGEILFLMVDNTENADGYVPTPIGHSVPFSGGEELSRLASAEVKKAVHAVGLDNCPINCDLIYKNGKVYVIEITARAGATCLPEIVSELYGINYYEAIAKLAMGIDVRPMFAKSKNIAVMAQTLMSEKTGTVRSLSCPTELGGSVINFELDIETGSEVRKYTNGRDRIGQIIVTGSDLLECRAMIAEVLDKIHIEID